MHDLAPARTLAEPDAAVHSSLAPSEPLALAQYVPLPAAALLPAPAASASHFANRDTVPASSPTDASAVDCAASFWQSTPPMLCRSASRLCGRSSRPSFATTSSTLLSRNILTCLARTQQTAGTIVPATLTPSASTPTFSPRVAWLTGRLMPSLCQLPPCLFGKIAVRLPPRSGVSQS